MKKYLLLILIMATCLSVAGETKLSGFFHYIKLSEGQKKALEDYKETHEPHGPFIMVIDKDPSSFSIIGMAFSTSFFLDMPSYYFSIYENDIVAIYNGVEKWYYPTPYDFMLMADFLSNFHIGSVSIELVDDEYKITAIEQKPEIPGYPPIYDPPIIGYKISGDSITKDLDYTVDENYPEPRFWNLKLRKYLE